VPTDLSISEEFFRNEEKKEEAREVVLELLALEETELLLNCAGGRAIGVLVGLTLLLLMTGAGCAPD
jgi:hypothetical protein